MQLGNLILRSVQLIFVAVVLGLSITLVRGQFIGGSPSITNFSVACGVFGAIAMLMGFVSVFVESLQGIIMAAVDGFATLFYLAGSIALAVKLGVHSCDGDRPDGWDDNSNGVKPPNPYCTYNPIINGGAIQPDPTGEYDFLFLKSNDWFVSRCREAQALDAFLFFALAAFAASLVLDLVKGRSRKVTAY